jgi:hypothetical protein
MMALCNSRERMIPSMPVRLTCASPYCNEPHGDDDTFCPEHREILDRVRESLKAESGLRSKGTVIRTRRPERVEDDELAEEDDVDAA